jgi:zinc-ribbon domain
MSDLSLGRRDRAIHAVDNTCPHCGAKRAQDQRYCVECGHALPVVTGRLPRWRRRWLRGLGWYPGDWVWPALAALLVAAVGAAAAIAVEQHRHPGGPHVITALGGVAVAQPAEPTATTAAATLPTPPEPTTQARARHGGHQVWPAGTTGWTIVLVSYPKTTGRPTAQRTATRAARTLPEVGILDSSRYASLQPGYFVVFSGIYPSQAEANSAVASAHQAGFGAAYSRQIAG